MTYNGRIAALDALSGKPAERPPWLLLTWGFDYMWKCAGVPPWQLALGGFDTWVNAYRATYERHKPDAMIFDGFGAGSEDGVVVNEAHDGWIVLFEGEQFEFIKRSYTLRHLPRGPVEPPPPLETIADIDRRFQPGGHDPGRLRGLKSVIDDIGGRTLVLPTSIPGYIAACYTLGFERAMTAMVDDERFFLHLADRLEECDDLRMRQFAEAGAEAVFIADAWASVDVLSPDMIRKFALPYQARSVDAAKAAGLKAILWNEGDVAPILADQAALNIDAFAFEQPRKGFGVSVAQVREAFGPNRCILGNLDSELMLLRNDPDEIREAVHRQIRESGQGAPFILSFGSPIPSNTHESAVDAVANALRECS
jgi:hypothetical protein